MSALVILDAGHRPQTPGKRSPDGRLIEHQWALECRRRVRDFLEEAGIKSAMLYYTDAPTEAADLKSRVAAANCLCAAHPCVLVSIHCNAATSLPKWSAASGWSVFVAPNASQASKSLAQEMAAQAEAQGFKVRRQHPNLGYWTQSLAICRDTRCPAVLVENFFMDNRADCDFLLSPQGLDQCAAVIARALIASLRP